jgi:hypothetical protein
LSDTASKEKTMDKFNASIIKSTTETLEAMAFLEVLPSPDATWSPAEGEAFSSTLLIHDPFQGELKLVMPSDLLGEISETVYAAPREELDGSVPCDLLAEILNTIAGRLMNELIPDVPYRLGLPEVEYPGELPDEPAARIWFFTIESHSFAIIAQGDSLLQAFD